MNTDLLENLITAEAVLLVLREQFAEPGDMTWSLDEEKITALVRGLDLVTLLMRDAERRLQGCAPAVLDGAVQNFMEEVDRFSREPRYLLSAESTLRH